MLLTTLAGTLKADCVWEFVAVHKMAQWRNVAMLGADKQEGHTGWTLERNLTAVRTDGGEWSRRTDATR